MPVQGVGDDTGEAALLEAEGADRVERQQADLQGEQGDIDRIARQQMPGREAQRQKAEQDRGARPRPSCGGGVGLAGGAIGGDVAGVVQEVAEARDADDARQEERQHRDERAGRQRSHSGREVGGGKDRRHDAATRERSGGARARHCEARVYAVPARGESAPRGAGLRALSSSQSRKVTGGPS